jgi:hypothetical protein
VPKQPRKKVLDPGDLVTGKKVSKVQTPVVQDPIDERVLVILSMIDELDNVGLFEVLRHTERALQPKAKAALASEPLWYTHVESTLSKTGIACLPFAALSGTSVLSTSWKKGCLACQAYVDQLGATSPAEVSHGRSLLLRCILSWMQKCNIPITFKTFTQQMNNVSTAMEFCFPGYRSSGLLLVLLKRRREERGSK